MSSNRIPVKSQYDIKPALYNELKKIYLTSNSIETEGLIEKNDRKNKILSGFEDNTVSGNLSLDRTGGYTRNVKNFNETWIKYQKQKDENPYDDASLNLGEMLARNKTHAEVSQRLIQKHVQDWKPRDKIGEFGHKLAPYVGSSKYSMEYYKD